jgi:hypothetical protein
VCAHPNRAVLLGTQVMLTQNMLAVTHYRCYTKLARQVSLFC